MGVSQRQELQVSTIDHTPLSLLPPELADQPTVSPDDMAPSIRFAELVVTRLNDCLVEAHHTAVRSFCIVLDCVNPTLTIEDVRAALQQLAQPSTRTWLICVLRSVSMSHTEQTWRPKVGFQKKREGSA